VSDVRGAPRFPRGHERDPRFTEIGLGREPEPGFTRASLAWFPFRNEHHTWRDPFTGLALPEDLLV
jgi:hypothetical protein